MTLEFIAAIILLTIFRLVWIVKRPVHKDITFYILPGLSNLRKIVRYDPNFSYVPYGLIWYAINVPIVRAVRYSGRLWIAVLALIDVVFLWYSSEFLGPSVFAGYVVLGTFQLLRAPWNASINWLIILAPISWIFLLLAPIAKFPVGLPVQVWRYTERAVGHQHNYIYFGLLGTLWIIVFNDLFFRPAIEPLLVAGLGIVWLFIFGYALLERRVKMRESAAKPSALDPFSERKSAIGPYPFRRLRMTRIVSQKANSVPEAFERSQVSSFNHKDINVKSGADPPRNY